MTVKSVLSHIAGQVFGFAMALVGCGLLFLEYHDGAAHAHTSHVIIYTAIFGVGCLIIAPALVSGAANKLVMIVVDAKKGGLRWTDPPGDIPAKPKIEKPPVGAGDV
jgi:hypothetical protein